MYYLFCYARYEAQGGAFDCHGVYGSLGAAVNDGRDYKKSDGDHWHVMDVGGNIIICDGEDWRDIRS